MHWRSSFFSMEVTFGPSEKKDTKRLTSIEMKCFRKEGYTRTLFEDKNNEDVSKKLKVEPVDENLGKYKSNWLHLTRMNKKRHQK